MPAIEVEIGEEEDDKARCERHFRTRPPHSLVAGGDADQFLEKAEIDADIGEHRPGQRRRGRQHRRALDHEEDSEKHREQTGDAEHDPAIEREGVDGVLVGVWLPEIDLRQVRRRKLGDEGDDGARIEGDAEDIGLLARLPVESKALRRGNCDDALGTEIGPEHFRIREPEMRRDDHAFELFFGHIGESKDRPVALMVLRTRSYLDAPADAVGTGGGRNLEGLSLVGIDFRCRGEIKSCVVAGDLDRLGGEGGRCEKADQRTQRGSDQARQPPAGRRVLFPVRRHEDSFFPFPPALSASLEKSTWSRHCPLIFRYSRKRPSR